MAAIRSGEKEPETKGYLREIEAFIEGAARGEQPVPLPEIGNVSLATLAIVETLRIGRPVRVGRGRLPER
jgi:hypothetical protein